MRNLANLYRKTKPSTAVQLYIDFLKILCSKESLYNKTHFQAVCSDIIDVLVSNKLYYWAYFILRDLLSVVGVTPGLMKNLLLVCDYISFKNPNICPQITPSLIEQTLFCDCSIYDQISFYFALAFHHYSNSDHKQAISLYDKGIELYESNRHLIEDQEKESIRSLITDNSWNFACLKIQSGDYRGWSKFDFGLQASAIGKQKWQRALVKPFSQKELPIWRGESLANKSILLLEEQAVGDAMMFMTCLPDIIASASKVGVYLSPRLVPIYNRSFKHYIASNKLSLYSKQDIIQQRLLPSHFDFQSPLGSVYQYIYHSFEQIPGGSFSLAEDCQIATQLKLKYFPGSHSDDRKPFVVGISWRGGGREDRIKQKSLPLDQFERILDVKSDITFVSLQYGDVQAQCEMWSSKGYNIIHDDSINALKDMDSWLAQVSLCDAVVSVANTTIHGAAGLQIPTMCLLSKSSDWRWFTDASIERSYWYPSVGIARQSDDGSWNSALSKVSSWLISGCPVPSGPQFI